MDRMIGSIKNNRPVVNDRAAREGSLLLFCLSASYMKIEMAGLSTPHLFELLSLADFWLW